MSKITLPYRMPEGVQDKVSYLSQLISLPASWLSFMPPHEACSLLTGVCLYHHLDRFERPKIMAQISALPGPKQPKIRDKILKPLISPYWGLWSLSTSELLKQHDFFSTISEAGSIAGITFSFASGVDAIRKIRASPLAGVPGLAASVSIWGFFWMNEKTRSQIQDEVFRRAAQHS